MNAIFNTLLRATSAVAECHTSGLYNRLGAYRHRFGAECDRPGL